MKLCKVLCCESPNAVGGVGLIFGDRLGPWCLWGGPGCSDEKRGHACTPGGGWVDAQPFGRVLSPLLFLILMPPADPVAHLPTSACGFSEPFPVTWELLGRGPPGLETPPSSCESRFPVGDLGLAAAGSFTTSVTWLLSALLPPASQTPSAHQNPPVPGGDIYS